MLFDSDDGEVFDNFKDFVKHLFEKVRDGTLDADDVTQAIADTSGMTREHAHDILMGVKVGLLLLNQPEIAESVKNAWLVQMPFGLGINMGFDPSGPDPDHFTDDQQEALAKVIAAILVMGGIEATVEGTVIRFAREDGTVGGGDIGEAIAQFRQQMDQELGPDAPSSNEGWGRWGV